jgi:hypothetical protein
LTAQDTRNFFRHRFPLQRQDAFLCATPSQPRRTSQVVPADVRNSVTVGQSLRRDQAPHELSTREKVKYKEKNQRMNRKPMFEKVKGKKSRMFDFDSSDFVMVITEVIIALMIKKLFLVMEKFDCQRKTP